MLAVSDSSRPISLCMSYGWRSTSSRRSATSSGPASSVEPSTSTTNSSPASRAAVSPSRMTLSQPCGDDPQQLVAGGVAEAVVDVLEAVDVDVQRRDRQLLAPRAREHLLGAVERQHAVGQAGERVVKRLVAQLAGLLPDHRERALARACEHQHERGQQQRSDHADEEHDQSPAARPKARVGRVRRRLSRSTCRPPAASRVLERMRRGGARAADEFAAALAGVLVVERHREPVVRRAGRVQQRADVEGVEHPADARLRGAGRRVARARRAR